MPANNTFRPTYFGPHRLADDVTSAISMLAAQLSVETFQCVSHSVVLVSQYGDDDSLKATSVYLVSAIAQNIEANLRIREALFDESDLSRDLAADVLSVIGDVDSADEFKKMKRNPWIWEAISHMLIHLSRRISDLHPSGHILAKTSIKYDVNDHGLDLIAIYEGAELGISAGECKAYIDHPSRGITDAANRLSEIDANVRDIEIRAAITQLREVLTDDVQAQLAGAFWRNERSYLPFVCCDDERSTDWKRNRKVLRRLSPPVARKILYPVSFANARDTFDRIGALMRKYVAMKK